MTRRVTATFTIDSWDEKPYDEFDDGRKIARASIKKSFTGEVEGEGSFVLGHAEPYAFTLEYDFE